MYRKLVILLTGFLFILPGCGAKNDGHTVAFQIMTSKKTNRGTPFYVVVKSTEVGEFYIDDYQTISQQALFEAEEEKELKKKVIIPGAINTIALDVSSENKPLAVYFLFTNPNEEWKLIFDNPDRKHYKILLGENGINASHSF